MTGLCYENRKGQIEPVGTGVRVDGVEYTADSVWSAIEALVESRDTALNNADFPTAVFLSHVIAYMSEYKEILGAQEE